MNARNFLMLPAALILKKIHKIYHHSGSASSDSGWNYPQERLPESPTSKPHTGNFMDAMHDIKAEDSRYFLPLDSRKFRTTSTPGRRAVDDGKMGIIVALITSFIITFGTDAFAQTAPDTVALPDINQMYGLLEAAEASGEYATVAYHLFEANRNLQSSELYLYGAFYYAKANNPDSSALALSLALDNGLANPQVLSKYNDLEVARQSGHWKEVDQKIQQLSQELKQLERFEIDTRSLDHFWPYFDKALEDTTQARELLKEYVLSGSPAIRDFYTIRYTNVDNMAQTMIQEIPEHYQLTQEVFANSHLDTVKQQVLVMMRTFSDLYEPAVFPKVYIVPGVNNTGGTATNLGLFVGAEKFVKSMDQPWSALSKPQQDSLTVMEGMQGLMMHELMHFQQNYHDEENGNKVIGGIIMEGVCDFLVEVCSGETRKEDKLDYLAQPENMKFIMQELKRDLYTEDFSNWLYNGGTIQDRPVDIGYTIGYKICKSYYEQSPDKKKAIFTLLNTDNFEEIYRNSEYAEVLKE